MALILLALGDGSLTFMMFRNGVKSLSEGFALSTLLLMAMKRTPFLSHALHRPLHSFIVQDLERMVFEGVQLSDGDLLDLLALDFL